jgi:hypothetical protein
MDLMQGQRATDSKGRKTWENVMRDGTLVRQSRHGGGCPIVMRCKELVSWTSECR